MASYRIEISRSAEKALFKLPKKILPKVIAALKGLEFDPYPTGCRKLSGEQNTFRIRVSNYRIIYEVFEKRILIKVLKIGHRKDIYR